MRQIATFSGDYMVENARTGGREMFLELQGKGNPNRVTLTAVRGSDAYERMVNGQLPVEGVRIKVEAIEAEQTSAAGAAITNDIEAGPYSWAEAKVVTEQSMIADRLDAWKSFKASMTDFNRMADSIRVSLMLGFMGGWEAKAASGNALRVTGRLEGSGIVCKGSLALGSGCGCCDRCKAERSPLT